MLLLWSRATSSAGPCLRRGAGGGLCVVHHSSFHYWQPTMMMTTTTTNTYIGTVVFSVSTTKETRTLCTTSAGVKPLLGDTYHHHHPTLYLHVGPSGDCWTGPSIFAAKHLPPDYVKSIPLDESLVGVVDRLLELLEAGDDDDDGQVWTRIIYDEGILPPKLLVRLREVQNVV